MDSKQLIDRFYSAFQQLDWKTMNSCYHPEATFTDPVFKTLSAKEAQAMWHMLCLNARNFTLAFFDVKATQTEGSCRWQAKYTFSKTGRAVENNIKARFTFKDGLIFTHTDQFDLWLWSRMALGMPGVLLGWSAIIQGKIHKTARQGLDKFIQSHPEYQ